MEERPLKKNEPKGTLTHLCGICNQKIRASKFQSHWARCFLRKEKSKESGPKGPGFALPPEGASMVFPLCGSLLEWWSNGVMKGPLQVKFGLSFLPNTPMLQYSKTARTCTSKAIELLSGPKEQVFNVE